MPYGSTSDLSSGMRELLPANAQRIFIAAFNSAWEEYVKMSPAEREKRARKAAWAAVKNKYRKDISTGKWVER